METSTGAMYRAVLDGKLDPLAFQEYVEDVRDSALENGYADGNADGYSEGYDVGYQDGWDEAKAEDDGA